MKHARPDYNRFQDPEGKIPDDEPVFIIRGQDPAGATAVRIYALLARDAGSSNDLVQTVHDHAQAMEDWHNKLAAAGKSKPADL